MEAIVKRYAWLHVYQKIIITCVLKCDYEKIKQK